MPTGAIMSLPTITGSGKRRDYRRGIGEMPLITVLPHDVYHLPIWRRNPALVVTRNLASLKRPRRQQKALQPVYDLLKTEADEVLTTLTATFRCLSRR